MLQPSAFFRSPGGQFRPFAGPQRLPAAKERHGALLHHAGAACHPLTRRARGPAPLDTLRAGDDVRMPSCACRQPASARRTLLQAAGITERLKRKVGCCGAT